jgi:FKBP12-rapamycin complex-associated protein
LGSILSSVNLDLHYVSPELEKLRDLQLVVPGTYIAGQKNVVMISKFAVKLTVIESKQRPRRFSLRGSDGRDYEYILKGE